MNQRGIECISKKQLREKLAGVSEATIWRWTKSGRLPQPRQIGPNRIAWILHEVEAAMEAFPVAECRPVAPGKKPNERARRCQLPSGVKATKTTVEDLSDRIEIDERG